MLDGAEDVQPDQDEDDGQGEDQAIRPVTVHKRRGRPDAGSDTLAPPIGGSLTHALCPFQGTEKHRLINLRLRTGFHGQTMITWAYEPPFSVASVAGSKASMNLPSESITHVSVASRTS